MSTTTTAATLTGVPAPPVPGELGDRVDTAGQARPARSPGPGHHSQPEATTAQPAGERSDIVVALAQIAPRLGDVDANLAQHLALIAEARGLGADLVVFPELSLTGYFLMDLVPEVARRLDSAIVATLAAASQDIDVVLGMVVETDAALFHNSAVYFAEGRVQHVHHKVYLPTYGLFDEQRDLAAGDGFAAFPAPLRSSGNRRRWRAGILVCEDMWHPSAVGILARDGVDLLLCPSASPARGVMRGGSLGTERSYDAMTRTYAQLFTAYIVYVNRIGTEDGISFWGGSRVVDPAGRLLTPPAGRDQSLVLHRLDLATLRRERLVNPLLRDERHLLNDAEHERLRLRRLGP